MVGSVDRRWRRGVRLGKLRVLARDVVEVLAGRAVVHGGEALELGFGHLVDEVGKVLALAPGQTSAEGKHHHPSRQSSGQTRKKCAERS